MSSLYRIRARVIDNTGRLSAIQSPFFVNTDPVINLLQFEYQKRKSLQGVSVEEWSGKTTTRMKAEAFLKKIQS